MDYTKTAAENPALPSMAPLAALGRAGRYLIYAAIMAIYSLPLLGIPITPPAIVLASPNGQTWLRVVHEFAGIIFIGHTVFSNIWVMRARRLVDPITGVQLQRMLRDMALGITVPTSIMVPLMGAMLVDGYFGGFAAAPWAREAYVAFWIMAAIQLVPDCLMLAVSFSEADAASYRRHSAIRGVISTILTIYIVWCMSSKAALFTT